MSFTHRFTADTDVVGPMLLTLTLSVDEGDDVSVFAGVRKFRAGREITFEGSYGFQGDLVTHGMLLASHRAVDPTRSRDGAPFHPHPAREPLVPGVPVRIQIGLLPSATHFRAGDELRLESRGVGSTAAIRCSATSRPGTDRSAGACAPCISDPTPAAICGSRSWTRRTSNDARPAGADTTPSRLSTPNTSGCAHSSTITRRLTYRGGRIHSTPFAASLQKLLASNNLG